MAGFGGIEDRDLGITDKLDGPHEWGYRDPVEGGFVVDVNPYLASNIIAGYRETLENLGVPPATILDMEAAWMNKKEGEL